MILGLDVSTSTTGFCVLNSKGCVVEIGYISLAKTKELCEKGAVFRENIERICKEHDVKHVFIEEAFQRYGRGMSSARTITRLASFNGIVQYICAADDFDN